MYNNNNIIVKYKSLILFNLTCKSFPITHCCSPYSLTRSMIYIYIAMGTNQRLVLLIFITLIIIIQVYTFLFIKYFS
jgi:hypothetical protein